MATLPEAKPETKPSTETIDVHEKKRQLEDYIRTVDSLHNLLTESAAQRDIEAYKNWHVQTPQ
jgi:hypothetical protein